MESVKSFIKKNLRLILLILCGVLVLTGIMVFIFGAAPAEDLLLKIAFIAFGIVLILLGCALVFLAAVVGESENANFFLYDSKRNINIPVEKLDFARVNKKMTFVMTKLANSASEVWTQNVFEEDNEVFNGETTYVPLVAYKILYDLGDRANEGIWNLYLSADASIIDSIASALELNGDVDLGKAFKFLYENSAGSYERTEKFLADNKKYIQNKMVKYVKANIEKF
jgi:hypothetical protein